MTDMSKTATSISSNHVDSDAHETYWHRSNQYANRIGKQLLGELFS
jgi:hypothetical protein